MTSGSTNTNDFILGLDVSTKTIGVALFEDMGNHGALKILTHASPKIKPNPKDKMEQLFQKVSIFENEFLNKYVGIGVTRVIIEEPLLRSNNVNTVGTLLRFNGMVSRSVYETLGIVPEFISSYDARKYGFPQLMGVRTHKKDGTPYSDNAIAKKDPTLFGSYDLKKIDKKQVVWEMVSDLEPQIEWMYTRNATLKTENFDMTDAYTCVRAVMKRDKLWD